MKTKPEPLRQLEAEPCISFRRALQARFTWQDEVHCVSGCPIETLRSFLAHFGGIALHDNPHHLAESLSCLDGYGDLGRWQAIDTLLFYRVVLPLSS